MNRSTIALITLLLCGLMLRLGIAAFLPPGYDEAYYYVYTLYPSWSYFDHPPLVGLVTAIGIWLSGGAVTQLSIRLGGVLLYTGTLFFLYASGLRLFGKRAALMTLAIATLIPFFQVGFGVLILPDSPLLFFCTAALYVAVKEFFPSGYCQMLRQASNAPDQVRGSDWALADVPDVLDLPNVPDLQSRQNDCGQPQQKSKQNLSLDCPAQKAQLQPELERSPQAEPIIFSDHWTAEQFDYSDRSDRVKKITYQPTSRIALIGLLVGLACLGKYHGFVFGLGLTIFCLVSPHHRRVFWSPWLLAAISLFLLAIAPMLIWNYQHDWASFRFQSARAVPQAGYNLVGLAVTFLSGIGYLFPSFGLPLWWVSGRSALKVLAVLGTSLIVWLKARKTIANCDRLLPKSISAQLNHFNNQPNQPTLQLGHDLLAQQQLLILCVALPIFLGFTLMGGYRQILPSWHMPGFFIATLLLGRQMAIADRKHPKRVKRWLWGSGAIVILLLAIALSHISIGAFQQGGRYALINAIPVENDASTELFYVQQLRQAFAESPQLSELLAQRDFIFTSNFFFAGQAAMALVPISQTPVTCFTDDMRGFAYWEAADRWVGQDGIYITSEEFWEPPTKYADYFDAITSVTTIPIMRGGQAIQQIYVFKADRLLKPYPRPY
ncbi:hypothetical protein Pse7367_1016 [Thalassoporum mexicanum PCC 7367]|uniref:ArnT family glycosyltransferase n=1 Tax=Thalassoporum mexicanum TaxID=3457544 RepID=UPI00029FA5E3|nr:glycosyltransferase family 39 protein [Pseudanabaena sp. PCC 7367]AFY69314.1 hypothetical protein Pse7367_1016 [Pseudanabaena sp. PCC 7367]